MCSGDIEVPATFATFRDPSGSVFRRGDRILRAVSNQGLVDLNALQSCGVARQLMESGRLVKTASLAVEEAKDMLESECAGFLRHGKELCAVVEHERIPFPSYPYEWPAEMLHAAGSLTLDLAQSCLAEDIGLKDATPYNILFQGPKPVFVDVLSFERRASTDFIWRPYAQFVRTFLLPLLANKYFGLRLDQTLTTARDGLEPEQVYRYASTFQRLSPTFLSLVTLPTWMGAKLKKKNASLYRQRSGGNPEEARFILNGTLNGLRRTLNKLRPDSGRRSTWSDYMATREHYSRRDAEDKHAFLRSFLHEFRPTRVLDVGCNSGFFSALAARAGARVVAVDYDPVVVGSVWKQAHAEKLDILPLVVDFTRPTPSLGWRGQECPSFLERATGHFDTVFLLAILHHMIVTERVPLHEILSVVAQLTTRHAVLEFVGHEDEMFQMLTRGREALYRDVTIEHFEAACRPYFSIVRRQHLGGTSRWLYVLEKHN